MSRSMTTETSEAKELALVGKVELRIALTDSDAKLESMLNIYLAPLLLKLASDHASVRNKVSILDRVLGEASRVLAVYSVLLGRKSETVTDLRYHPGHRRMSAYQY